MVIKIQHFESYLQGDQNAAFKSYQQGNQMQHFMSNQHSDRYTAFYVLPTECPNAAF